MSEIAELPWNGLNVVSTFSGCGGSCLGFRMAGYRVLWASEFVPAARETYRANNPSTVVDGSDIRLVTGAMIREVIGDIDIDVLEGSPPCASFSTAGKQQRGWGQVRKYSDVQQRTDDLFAQYVRLVNELRPRVFVAENVAGMVKGVSKGHFKRYLAMMEALPYRVEARLVDAQDLGVPQRRNRLIFVGVRNDVGAPAWPVPLRYRYSIRDAIPWLAGNAAIEGPHGFDGHAFKSVDDPAETIVAGRALDVEIGIRTREGIESLDAPAPTVLTHGNAHTRSEMTFVVKAGGAAPSGQRATPIGLDDPSPTVLAGDCQFFVEPESALSKSVGGEWDKLAPGEQSDKYMSLILPTDDEPCPTVTALGGTSAASVAHPYERRKFSIAELRRICGFPDDFVLVGTYAQQWERLGRAVAPPMMAAIARALIPVLKKETR